jgi:hypothetical protein
VHARRVLALPAPLKAAALRPALVAGALAAVAARAGWRGADMPNLLFRIEMFRRAGFTIWSSAWYGGHTTPGYSVLLAPLGAVAGPGLVGAASAVVAAVCFDLLLRRVPEVVGSRAAAASLLFAAGTVVNLAIGRLAFALGLALGLAALAARRRHRWLALVLSVATPLGSPVAGVFLLLAWLAVAIHARHRREALTGALVLAAATLAPLAVLGGAFPEAGRFPFRMAAWALTVAACAAAHWLPRSLGPVRIGAGLYAAAATLTFVLANPLGANVTRLGMFVLAPLLVATATLSRRALALLVVPLLWWQWSPAVDAVVRSGRDPSTDEAYYQPLLDELNRVGQPVGRIEIPLTLRHFEAAYVAPVVPIARGGERQLDIAVNGIFYRDGPLSPAAYRRWLLDNGVRYVALPDAPLDEAAEAEAVLLKTGPSFLTPVWTGAHWRLWRVVGADGLVEGPAALVEQTAETVVLDASSAGDVVVRVHASALWSVDGPACVEPIGGEWVHLQVRSAGRLELHPVLLGSRNRCPG